MRYFLFFLGLIGLGLGFVALEQAGEKVTMAVSAGALFIAGSILISAAGLVDVLERKLTARSDK